MLGDDEMIQYAEEKKKYSFIKEDETPIEAIRRLSNWSNFENESIYDDLTTTDAVLEYWEMVHHYGVDSLDDVYESIAEDECPKALNDFIVKHKLNWRTA